MIEINILFNIFGQVTDFGEEVDSSICIRTSNITIAFDYLITKTDSNSFLMAQLHCM